MANSRATSQQLNNVSINKSKLIEIAGNSVLSKKDLRVLLCLFTELEGYVPPKIERHDTKDPLNYTKIDVKSISEIVGITKKEVKKCIENLIDAELLDPGDSETIKNGYRFMF